MTTPKAYQNATTRGPHAVLIGADELRNLGR